MGWALVGRALVGWALVGPLGPLWAPLGRRGPGPRGPPWALVVPLVLELSYSPTLVKHNRSMLPVASCVSSLCGIAWFGSR